MKELRVEETQKLSEILEAIKSAEENEIEIANPTASVFQVGLNKEVLLKAAQSFGKNLKFRENGVKIPPAAVNEKENLGFVEGQDVAQVKPTEPAAEPEHALEIPKKKRSLFKIPKIKGPKWFYAIVVVLILLVAGAYALVTFLPSATVELQTTTQFKESQLTVVASANATSVDEKTATIPLKKLEITLEDSLEATATGTKETGTVAKGTVSIINHDSTDSEHDGSKTFVEGTLLVPTSGSTVQFTLDEAVTIPASPPACTSNCEARSVGVTAKSIGEAGNLPADTTFQVGSAKVSLVAAKATVNFSGGTSKKLKVVSADDQKKASDDLLLKLSEKASQDLKSKNPDMIVPDGSIENQVLQKTFTKQVNEEAETFKLTMEIKFTANVVTESDLKKVLTKSILEEASDDFKLEDENTTITSEVIEKTASETKLLAKIKAGLSPSLNEGEIKNKIAGKKFAEVEDYLKSLNSVSGFEIKVEPTIFTFLQKLPSLKDKIQIKISQEE